MWIIDSGAAHDLIGREYISQDETNSLQTVQAPGGIDLTTAAGNVNVTQAIPVPLKGIPDSSEGAYVLDNCPPVISMGRLCMDEGCSIHWLPGQNPILTTPDGNKTVLELHNNVPVMAAPAAPIRKEQETQSPNNDTIDNKPKNQTYRYINNSRPCNKVSRAQI